MAHQEKEKSLRARFVARPGSKSSPSLLPCPNRKKARITFDYSFRTQEVETVSSILPRFYKKWKLLRERWRVPLLHLLRGKQCVVEVIKMCHKRIWMKVVRIDMKKYNVRLVHERTNIESKLMQLTAPILMLGQFTIL